MLLLCGLGWLLALILALELPPSQVSPKDSAASETFFGTLSPAQQARLSHDCQQYSNLLRALRQD